MALARRRRGRPSRLLPLVVAALALAGAYIAETASAATTHTVEYSGQCRVDVVPPSATTMTVTAVGGTGGNDPSCSQPGWGTYVRTTVPVEIGQIVRVGGDGHGSIRWHQGGDGGDFNVRALRSGGNPVNAGSGGSGGYVGGGNRYLGQKTLLITAGAGGGCAGSSWTAPWLPAPTIGHDLGHDRNGYAVLSFND